MPRHLPRYGIVLVLSLLVILFVGTRPFFSNESAWGLGLVGPSYYVPMPSSNAAPVRANATLFMLARNSEVDNAVKSIRALEDRFNRERHYPWTFLNDEPFTDDFMRRVKNVARGPVSFGLIPEDHWVQPDWIDESRAATGRKALAALGNVPYADSISYRNMCRFNSGFFFRHELLKPYKWYWRVEPGVDFTCNIRYDPFRLLENKNKVYGWTIALQDFGETIPTLWDTTREFMAAHPQYVASHNSLEMMLGLDGADENYNACHFWSNFEIADLDFWRSDVYTQYFEFLDKKGGFYYERWGDAPVHSLALAVFLPREKIHFFEDIGYEHPPINHCPQDKGTWAQNGCQCGPEHTYDYSPTSDQCRWRWDDMTNWRPE